MAERRYKSDVNILKEIRLYLLRAELEIPSHYPGYVPIKMELKGLVKRIEEELAKLLLVLELELSEFEADEDE